MDNDKVVDSRAAEDGAAVRRRRQCLGCSRRFTTYERIEDIPLRVIKKDGSRVPFDRNKILTGLLKACDKTSVSTEAVEKLVQEVEGEINERGDTEVESRYIGELVMRKLRELNQIAYVRFASVYREFRDLNQFLEELRPLLEKKEPPQKSP
jgi:transcriptional repressor NrdR